jgi:hypothetical protein
VVHLRVPPEEPNDLLMAPMGSQTGLYYLIPLYVPLCARRFGLLRRVRRIRDF